ncbi:hypothetical protein [Tenacibaculum sp. 190524A05c]|uniref:hypothetical protein n=1 Tax=Tenacibaculum platacis TaxID=3137852 RepID=UPI0032B1D195
MKIRPRGSTYLLKISSILLIMIGLWNCKNEDYGILTSNEHTSHEEYHNPFQKINYTELVKDLDFGKTVSLLENHSSDLVINKQAYRGKSTSDEKVKLSIVQD